MALADIAPTKEDFDRSGWQDVITDSSAKDIDDYASLCIQKAHEAQSKGDSDTKAVFELLYYICSLRLNLDNPREPFSPSGEPIPWRVSTADDFSVAHLDTLLG